MEIITKENQKLCVKFGINDICEGLVFFSESSDFLQVGGWCYESGKEIIAHNHNVIKRDINRTQEFLFVLTGSLECFIYDDDDNLFKTFFLNANEGLIMFSGGHGFNVIEPNTKVIEVKNGPYLGHEVDRRRLINGY